MKASKSILTHTAVFAVGAAIAVIANRQSANDAGVGSIEENSRTSSSRQSVSADSASDSRAAVRERRDSVVTTSHTAGSSIDRIAGIAKLGDPLERQLALVRLLEGLGADEFEAVANEYRNSEHYEDSRGEFDLILRSWTKANPMAAIEYAKGSRGRSATVLSAWAVNDPAAAERWASENHKGDGPNPYMASVIRGMAAFDIEHASDLARAMPSSRERGYAMEAITRALFVQGLDAALAYPSTIEDPRLKAGFVAMISQELASKDPEQAATWLAKLPDTDSQLRSARRVAEALAQKDISQAAAWVRQLSPEAQAEAARGVIIPMSNNDIAGAAEWVSTLSGIPNYDSAVEEFVWSCDQRAPEQSAAWIQGVSDPHQQRKLYYRMLSDWGKRDSNAMRQWVASNNVPPEIARKFGK